MLRLGIDPEKLYRATFICQDGLCYCNMALISFRLFRKNLGNLRDFFGQMVYRPPWQKISRTPMQTEKNCSALALYRKLETIKGSVISAFRMGFFFKNIILPVFVAPPQFCISIVFNFPQWDSQSPQENLKTTSMQNVKGTTKSIMEFLKKAF